MGVAGGAEAVEPPLTRPQGRPRLARTFESLTEDSLKLIDQSHVDIANEIHGSDNYAGTR